MKLGKKLIILSLGLPLILGAMAAISYQAFNNQEQSGEKTFVTKVPKRNNNFSLIEVAYFVYAAENGDTATVEKYLSLGIDVNAKDQNNDTALMGASLNGHEDIVLMLLANNADPTLKNSSGYTSLDFSEIHNRSKMTALLSENLGRFRNLSSIKK